jgi:hypothetical protein
MNLSELFRIKIGPFELRGELLFLTGIMLWVIFINLCVSCLRIRFGIEEGFDLIKNVVENGVNPNQPSIPIYKKPIITSDLNIYPRTPIAPSDNLAVSALKGELLNSNTNTMVNVGSYYAPIAGYKSFQVPNDKLDMMSGVNFKPDCCPSSYTNSMGCACIDPSQQKFLSERGGNNYPKSEY